MEKELRYYADKVKDREYEDLFPETDVEDAKRDEEKIKEALFQVHQMVYSKELFDEVTPHNDNYHISIGELKEQVSEKQFERLTKLLGEDDEDLTVPRRRIKNLLTLNKERVYGRS
jgi:hypothetical protein